MNDERQYSGFLWLILFILCPPILGLLILVATVQGLFNLVTGRQGLGPGDKLALLVLPFIVIFFSS